MKDKKLNELRLLEIGAALMPEMTVLELAGMIKEWSCHGFGQARCELELQKHYIDEPLGEGSHDRT